MKHTPLIVPEPDEVHVWRFSLDLPTAHLVRLEHLLAPDEQTRAERLPIPQLRNRFIVGRGMMRRLLGCYVGSGAETLSFRYGSHGKPFLMGLDSSLEFNLTHSAGRALLAVAQQPVGIDLECVTINLDIDSIASSFFTPVEHATLQLDQEIERNRRFFTLWVRKEALMKAVGKGLSQALAEYNMVADTSGLIMHHTWSAQTGEVTSWHVYDLEVEKDSVAALAVTGSNCHRIRYFELECNEAVNLAT